MKGKKRKGASPLSISLAERHLRPIAAVLLDESSDREAVQESLEELMNMEGRYILPPEYYSLRMIALSTLGRDIEDILKIAEAGKDSYPHDAFIRFNLGASYLEAGYLLLAYRELHHALESWTQKEADFVSMDQIRDRIRDIESEAPELLASAGLEWPTDQKLAAAGEQVRRYLELGALDECITLGMEILDDRPEQNHVRNNLARALWENGRMTEAVTHQEESLRRAPDRLAGLANMVRFCTVTNRTDRARPWADHARNLAMKTKSG
ncbi:MAG: hypothetical protein WD492_08240 [Alkalispirochaeta sp.]